MLPHSSLSIFNTSSKELTLDDVSLRFLLFSFFSSIASPEMISFLSKCEIEYFNFLNFSQAFFVLQNSDGFVAPSRKLLFIILSLIISPNDKSSFFSDSEIFWFS